MQTPSSYYTNQTMQEVAARNARDLLTDPDVSEETGYGATTSVQVTITLSGGGPASWVTFTFPEGTDPDSAVYTYAEPWEEPNHYTYTPDEADDLLYRLTRPAETD